jgi:hypothetical protein
MPPLRFMSRRGSVPPHGAHALALSLLARPRSPNSNSPGGAQRTAPIAPRDQRHWFKLALYSLAGWRACKSARLALTLSGGGSAEARIGDPDLLWQIQFGRARVQDASGDVSAALASLEAAVALIEGVRGRLLEARFRSGYVEDKFEVYLELMRLQLQHGKTAEAFSTAERLRPELAEQLGGRAPRAGDRRRSWSCANASGGCSSPLRTRTTTGHPRTPSER